MTTVSTTASPESATPTAAPDLPMFASRMDQAAHIIRRKAAWAFGGGIVPVPVLDLVVVSGVQLKMLSELSALYGVPFSANAAKSIVSALLGSLVPSGIAHGATGFVLRSIPFIGPILGGLVMPAFSSAATWAIGRVFVQHFESGGTFLDFDPAKVREHFKAEFMKAQAETKAPVEAKVSPSRAAA